MIGSGVTRPSSIIRMKRGRSWRMRQLPFWALRIRRLCAATITCGSVTVESAVAMLVTTIVPPRRDIVTACACASGTVAASST